MRPSITILAAALFLSFTVTAWSAGELVIRNVTVIDVADRGASTNDIEDAVIVIRDGKISSVGPAAEVGDMSSGRQIDVLFYSHPPVGTIETQSSSGVLAATFCLGFC